MNTQINNNKYQGFTIVELLIVIVVIAILAAITIVSFNGITRSAVEASLKSDLRNTAAQLGMVRIEAGAYPPSLGDYKAESDGNTLAYTTELDAYCLQASSPKSTKVFRVTEQGVIEEGECTSAPALSSVSRLGVGVNHTCGIAGDNWLYCWGADSNGQLGNGATTDNMTTPVVVSRGHIPTGSTLTVLSAGDFHNCALASNNSAYCWGLGGSGQLGIGGLSPQSTPSAVSQGAIPAGVTLTTISAGGSNTCGIASNNRAYCWGTGLYGNLGNGDTVDHASPVAVSQGAIPSGGALKKITVGSNHSCGIANDDWVYCWGSSNGGQLGNGGTEQQLTPVVVSRGAIPSGATVVSVSAGTVHTCAIASDGWAYCWGYGLDGRLGNGATATQSTPVAVSRGAIPAGVTLTSITAGNNHTCAIASNNQTYCWGNGASGKLGNGATTSQSTPVAVSQGAVPLGVRLTSIYAANAHTCALASDNRAYCWGSGSSGKLGNDTTTAQSTPVAVLQGAIPGGVTF